MVAAATEAMRGTGRGRIAVGPLRRIKARSLWQWGLFAVVAFLVVAPLVLLVLGSFSVAPLPGEFTLSGLTLNNYKTVWLDPSTYNVISNTVIYVIGASTFGLTIAIGLAWLVERTNIPGKAWIYAGVPLTLAMPGMLQGMAYVLLLSPRIGFINTLLKEVGLGAINIYSLGGMMFVEGLRLVPTAFLMLVPLLRSMDPSLEEAAAMSAASPRSTLRKVTLRLMLPGLLGILIYSSMTALEVFEVPGILGMPAGIHVFATKIYTIIHTTDGIPHYGNANALAIIYVLIGVAATWCYARVIGRSERYSIITGKGYRPRELDLGAWRWPAFCGVLLFLMASVILPFIVLGYVSLLSYVQQPSIAAFEAITFENYTRLFDEPRMGRVMWNTTLMTAGTATLTMILSFLISIIVVRTKFSARGLLNQLSFLPHAIPGIVMGLAFLWVFLQGEKFGIPLFGGIWSIVIVFTVGFISYGTRAMNAAILQIHKDLEEAAYVSGAIYWRTMWRVFYPLMLPTFVGVWIWTMLHAVRQAGTPLILTQGSENAVLAVAIWRMWDDGEIGMVGAVGVLLIATLLLITLILRYLAFGRGAAVQRTNANRPADVTT
jgi:iron(III) transport system permease protein